MRNRSYINDNWYFKKGYQNNVSLDKIGDDMEQIRVPHTVQELPQHYSNCEDYQTVSLYQRILHCSLEDKNKPMVLTFEAVAHEATVYINGAFAFSHQGGYTAFSGEIQHLIKEGENILSVVVDSRECLNIPPFGNVVDYLTYGGIYRDVYLERKEENYITRVAVETTESEAKVTVFLKEVNKEAGIRLQLKDDKGATVTETSVKAMGTEINVSLQPEHVKRWSVENPTRYELVITLQNGDQEEDIVSTKIGFRSAVFREDGFYLNGTKVTLRGLNRHQCFAYTGYAMPESMQRYDARILKEELGVNAVRTSHYPQSHYFMDECDKLGILVFTELPGWQHIGNDAWKESALKQVEEMVTQYCNHPSIILWGARINESADDECFYQRTNELIHRIDPSRQTGGVRCFKQSQLLEDVYTYNDFSFYGDNEPLEQKRKVSSNHKAPYLVSEYNGHIYPTKSFDDEAHRREHARRHAKVMNEYYKRDGIAGGFGWCMFDYPTHNDFGSGDGICYHGVMDLFRNPKLAAAVYGSQQKETPVLEVSSRMNIGEHKAANIGEVFVYTNADFVRLYRNDDLVGEYQKDQTEYGAMPNAPIRIKDFVGNLLVEKEGYSVAMSNRIKKVLYDALENGMDHISIGNKLRMAIAMVGAKLTIEDGMRLFNTYIGNWGQTAVAYRFEAVKNGVVVKEKILAPVTSTSLELTVSSTELKENTSYDVASIRIRTMDQNGVAVPYNFEPLQLEVNGDLSLIGPSVITLEGGMGGTYVKSIKQSGTGSLTIRRQSGELYTINFTTKATDC